MVDINANRVTVLQCINKVRKRLGYKEVTSLTADKLTETAVERLNDVIDITSDFGDWKEAAVTLTVTASNSVRAYTIETSSVIKNIHEISFNDRPSPMRYRDTDDMLRWRRVGNSGVPNNWSILETEVSGNPIFEVYPVPGSAQNNQTFSLYLYTKPAQYEATASFAGVHIPYPSRLIVNGLEAFMRLDESGGSAQTDVQTQFKEIYEPMLEQAYNRYNGDSGSDSQFRPATRGGRRV